MPTTILSPLTERESSRRQSYRVDRTKGIIYGVKLGQSRSRNQGTPDSDVDLPRVYTSKLMEKFVGTSGSPGLYHDIPVQQGHKPVPAEERMGRVYNPRFETVSGQRIIIGDWHLNTKHRLFEQFMEDAEKFPGNIALSHEIVDWKESETDDSILIEDASEVLWFSVVGDGGLNKSLDESKDTTPKPPTNPFLNVALSLFEDRIMPKKLTDQSTLAELAELNPNLAKRLLEECGCSDPPYSVDDGNNAAMMLRLKQLEEENNDLKQREARSQLKTSLAGYYKQLTEGLDKSLITELSDEQLTAFSMMEEATAKAAIEAIVNTIKTTAKTVAESFNGQKSSLMEKIDYPESNGKKLTPQYDLSRFSGAHELSTQANRLAEFLG